MNIIKRFWEPKQSDFSSSKTDLEISAMITFQFCSKLQDKHCREHYDYDKINFSSLSPISVIKDKIWKIRREIFFFRSLENKIHF